jgi:hypothetical protein
VPIRECKPYTLGPAPTNKLSFPVLVVALLESVTRGMIL